MQVFLRAVFFTFTDTFTEVEEAFHQLAHMHHFQAFLEFRRITLPMETFDLTHRKPDQRIPMPDRMIHEGERLVSRERDKPKREFGEVDRDRIAVHSVQAETGVSKHLNCDKQNSAQFRALASSNAQQSNELGALGSGSSASV